MTGKFGNEVNALISHVLPTFSLDANASAALQVAIWKAEYGAALSVWGNEAVTSLAATYLHNLSSGAWTADPNERVAVLVGRGNQRQVYLSATPEPASLAVLGAALLGTCLLSAAGLARRR